MTKAIAFWVLMLLLLVSYFPGPWGRWPVGGIIQFLCLALLGYAVFGAALK